MLPPNCDNSPLIGELAEADWTFDDPDEFATNEALLRYTAGMTSVASKAMTTPATPSHSTLRRLSTTPAAHLVNVRCSLTGTCSA